MQHYIQYSTPLGTVCRRYELLLLSILAPLTVIKLILIIKLFSNHKLTSLMPDSLFLLHVCHIVQRTSLIRSVKGE